MVTVVIGFRHVFVRSPWQTTYIAAYAAFLGEVGESYIIDVQHWRHYYLIMGMVWGLLVAGRAARGSAAPERPAAYAARPAPGLGMSRCPRQRHCELGTGRGRPTLIG